MKKIIKILLLFFIFVKEIFPWMPNEDGKWAYLVNFKNSTDTKAYIDVRCEFLEKSGGVGGWEEGWPYGWATTADIPKMDGAVIPVGKKVSIEPKQQVEFSELSMVRSFGAAHPAEKKIRFTGLGEETMGLSLTPDSILNLDPYVGSAILWLRDSIDGNKAVTFESESEDEVQIVFGSELKGEWLVKVILGQEESKIITKEEYDQELQVDTDGLGFICYGDEIYLKNEKSGNILKNDIKMGKDDGKFIPEKTWRLDEKYQDLDFLESSRTVALYAISNKKYLSGQIGGALTLEPYWDRFERWRVLNLENRKDKRIKDGDRVNFDTVDFRHTWLNLDTSRTQAKLTEEGNVGKIRYNWQTQFQNWKIFLVNKKQKPIYPKVTRLQNPKAVCALGNFGVNWVNIKDNTIWVGYGDKPGENIFLFKRLSQKLADKLVFMGFSSNKRKARLRNIITTDAVELEEPLKVYKKLSEEISSAAADLNYTWLSSQLRSLYQGAISFKAKTEDKISVALASKPLNKEIKYLININSKIVEILKQGKKGLKQIAFSTVDKDFINLKDLNDYRISNKGGFITVEVNNKTLLIWQDPEPVNKSNYIGFNGNAVFSDITVMPSVKINQKKRDDDYYKKVVKRTKTESSLQVKLAKPVSYSLIQGGSSILLTEDIYAKETFSIAGLREKGAHFFRAEILPNGQFSLVYAEAPKGDIAEKILNSIANVAFNIGSGVESMGAAQASSVQWSKGRVDTEAEKQAALDAGKKGVQTKQEAAMAAMWMQIGGASTKAAAQLLADMTALGYAPTEGLYSEKIRLGGSAYGQTSEEVLKSKAEIQRYLVELEGIGKTIDISTENGFNIVLDRVREILNRIIAPDIVLPDEKDRILLVMQKLYDKISKQGANNYSNLVSLLILASNNRFFLDPSLDTEKTKLDEIYVKVNKLTSILFGALRSGKISSFDIPALQGEFIWYDQDLPSKNKGTIYWQDQGSKDIMVGFYSKRFKIQNIGAVEDLYVALIGGIDNTISSICSDGNFNSEVFETNNNKPEAMARKRGFRERYLSFDKGKIEYGVVVSGKAEKILEWNDQYWDTVLSDRIIPGFSSWDNSYSIKNIIIGNSINEILSFLYPQNTSAQTVVTKQDMPMAQDTPSTSEKVVSGSSQKEQVQQEQQAKIQKIKVPQNAASQVQASVPVNNAEKIPTVD